MGVLLFLSLVAAVLGYCKPEKDIINISSSSDLSRIRSCPCCDFQMTADITVPNSHVPIAKFSGSLNGNGNSLYISGFRMGMEYGDFGFFESITVGQVFNLNIVLTAEIAVPGTARNFGLLAGYATDPYLYNITLLGQSTEEATIRVGPVIGGNDSPLYLGGLIGGVLLEGHTLTHIFARINLSIESGAAVPTTIGAIFGSIGGTQRINSIRVDTESALSVNAQAAPKLTVGGAIGSSEGSRIVTTSSAVGRSMSVFIGSATDAVVGGFVGVASQLNLINTSWGYLECTSLQDGIGSSNKCILGGIAGIIKSTADDTRRSVELATHSLGNLTCSSVNICYVGGIAGGVEDSDVASARNFMNIIVYDTLTCQVGGVLGYTNGGRLNMASSASQLIDVNANRSMAVHTDSVAVVGGVVGSIERAKSSGYVEAYQCYARVQSLTVQGKGMIITGGFAGRTVTFVSYQKNTRYEMDIDVGADIRRCGAAINNYTVKTGYTGATSLADLYLSVGGLVGDMKLGRISSSYYYSKTLKIIADKNAVFAGGLVALGLTSIIEYSSANVGTFEVYNDQANAKLYSYVGGAVGSLTNTSTLRSSYANINSSTLSTTTTLYYGGVVGSVRSSSITTSFGIIKTVSITRKASATMSMYVGGFVGGTRLSSDIAASWVKGDITVADETSGSKPMSIGGFIGSVGDTYIGQSYAEIQLAVDKDHKGCGRFAGYVYSNTNLSQNLALTKITSTAAGYNVRGFCGIANQYYTSNNKSYDNTMLVSSCIAYKTDSETPDDNPADNSNPTNPDYLKGITYVVDAGLKKAATYSKWSKITQTATKAGRYNITENSYPTLTQLPNLKPDRTLFGTDYTLVNIPCTYSYSCWLSGKGAPWKLSTAKVYNTLPIASGSLLNECRGISSCKTNAPGLVTCKAGVQPVDKDFTCVRCTTDSSCNSFNSTTPGTCNVGAGTCNCGLGTAGATCEITFCESMGRKCSDPKIGICGTVSGVTRCLCAPGYYAFDNQCVERHANWNRVPYEPTLKKSIVDVSLAPVLILLAIFLIVAALAVYFGLASYGKISIPCVRGGANVSSSSIRIIDSNNTISTL